MAQDDRDTPTPAEQVARLYEQAETTAAKAGEHLVGSGGFAAVLGQVAENAAALAKIGNDAMDLVWRNLRLASQRDLVRVSRQLGRTEDKLERVLQELEDVRDELGRSETRATRRNSGSSRASRGNGAATREQKTST